MGREPTAKEYALWAIERKKERFRGMPQKRKEEIIEKMNSLKAEGAISDSLFKDFTKA